MTEDVLDAVRWAVKKGQVDGRRVCAYGASYGAYASMQAATLAPELFRCAVGYSGVYDLTRMMSDDDAVLSRRVQGFLRRAVGTDEAELRAMSPVYNAARLKLPILLFHGGMDTRTPIGHAKALRDALEEAGNPPEWVVEPAEGHGFLDPEARVRLYTRLLAFLAKHIGSAPVGAKAAGTAAP